MINDVHIRDLDMIKGGISKSLAVIDLRNSQVRYTNKVTKSNWLFPRNTKGYQILFWMNVYLSLAAVFAESIYVNDTKSLTIKSFVSFAIFTKTKANQVTSQFMFWHFSHCKIGCYFHHTGGLLKVIYNIAFDWVGLEQHIHAFSEWFWWNKQIIIK